MASTATTTARKLGKGIDLKYQPGFSQIAWFCIAVLYALERFREGYLLDEKGAGASPKAH